MQNLLRVLFPPQCISCGEGVASDGALCGACWHDTPFLGAFGCDLCGHPLIGRDTGRPEICDDCLLLGRPWTRGRAVLAYRGNGRRLVLALKHGDRTDLVPRAAAWMHLAAGAIVKDAACVIPVPVHWSRLVRRRYSPAALLAQGVARAAALEYVPDALLRLRRTPSQDGRTRDARFENLDNAIAPHPRRARSLAGRRVVVVDDVMTSGATLAATCRAAHAAGATEVSILVLARAIKDT